jgi:hypothetical protein
MVHKETAVVRPRMLIAKDHTGAQETDPESPGQPGGRGLRWEHSIPYGNIDGDGHRQSGADHEHHMRSKPAS